MKNKKKKINKKGMYNFTMYNFTMNKHFYDSYNYFRKYEHKEALIGALSSITNKKFMTVIDVINCQAIIYVLYERGLIDK